MKTFWKRWRVSIGSGFESLITKVENHEALVAEAIREAQSAAAKAKVKLAHVRRDGERLRTRILELENAEADWGRRAQAQAESNRERALECLRRCNTAKRELEHLRSEVIKHEQTERSLAADIGKLEDHVAGLKRKKNTMAARDFRARALAATDPEQGTVFSDVDDIFERWELKLAETEIIGGTESIDHFEDSFMAEEEKTALEAQLDEMVSHKPKVED